MKEKIIVLDCWEESSDTMRQFLINYLLGAVIMARFSLCPALGHHKCIPHALTQSIKQPCQRQDLCMTASRSQHIPM